ncbi:MAG: MoaD/ThiS family protein [Rhodothermales bacterium]|nr:MoaD/ThiS family protein [Rhodothermales bacterium]
MSASEPVRVRLFSVLKERTGQSEILLDAGDVDSVGAALSALGRTYPVIADYRRWIRPAVNRAYADEDTLLKSGDELALITPVSGG